MARKNKKQPKKSNHEVLSNIIRKLERRLKYNKKRMKTLTEKEEDLKNEIYFLKEMVDNDKLLTIKE